MEFTKSVRDSLVEETINYLDELIKVQKEYQGVLVLNKDSKTASPINFKIKGYQKWIKELKSIQTALDTQTTQTTQQITVEYLKTHKLSDKCITRMIELNDTNETSDIKEVRQKTEDLKKVVTQNFIEHKTTKNKNKSEASNIQDISFESSSLQKIHGIGEVKAAKLLKAGIKLSDFMLEWNEFVKGKSDNLTPSDYFNTNNYSKFLQFNKDIKDIFIKNKFKNTKYLRVLNYDSLIGIKYYHDIQERIPRDEITQIKKIFSKCLKLLNKDMIMEVCGSYRRGTDNSGDIDILITHPSIKEEEDFASLENNFLLTLIIQLTKAGFLKDHLTINGATKYMGMCKLNGGKFNRRIDIRFISYNSYVSALLYFTGSGNLNQKMRTQAIKKGYKLNEYGLFKLEFNKKTNKMEKTERIPCQTERDIFKELDYDWLKPTERNI
jgi:hypothetical protein